MGGIVVYVVLVINLLEIISSRTEALLSEHVYVVWFILHVMGCLVELWRAAKGASQFF